MTGRNEREQIPAQSPSDSRASSSGFTGDTTTSWDGLALEEVIAAENELRFSRWRSFATAWEQEEREEEVCGICDVQSLLTYIRGKVDNPTILDLSIVDQETVCNELGVEFLRELWISFKGEGSVLRGRKRKNSEEEEVRGILKRARIGPTATDESVNDISLSILVP